MKKMFIYEPAMCCSTGLCGVSVDPELLRISTVLNNLKKNGILVERYNLTNAPQEFIKNKEVNEFINKNGVEELPLILVDNAIVMSGRYPSNEEFVNLLEVPKDILVSKTKPVRLNIKKAKSNDCGCSDGSCC